MTDRKLETPIGAVVDLESVRAQRESLAERLPDGLGDGADLRDQDLRGRELAGADLRGVQLDGADLRDSGLVGAQLQEASLVGARLSGADLSDADLSGANLEDAILDGATLDRAVLHDTKLTRARVRDSLWSGTNISGGSWRDVNLTGARFHQVRLADLEIYDPELSDLRVDDSDWSGLVLVRPKADGLHIADSTLSDVAVRGGSLEGAQFRFVNLDRVAFEEASLARSRFESVLFRNCSFRACEADSSRFVRCAGLSAPTVNELREMGAHVPLSIVRRLWRGLGRVPAGRVSVAVAALIAVIAFGFFRQQGAVDSSPPAADESNPGHLFGKDPAAAQAWQKLEAHYLSHPKGRVRTTGDMAALLERHGYLEEAEDRLREMVGLSRLLNDGPPTEAHIVLAEFLMRGGRFDDAFDVVRLLVNESPSARAQLPGYLLLTRIRLGQGDPEGAQAELTTAVGLLKSYPMTPAVLRLEVAGLLDELGRTSEALSVLTALPATAPDEMRARVGLVRAEMFGRIGHAAQALRAYDELLAEHQDLPLMVAEAREGRTRILAMEHDPETEARQLEILAQATEPSLAVQGEIGLARLAVRSENTAEAIRRYESIRNRFESRTDLRLEATIELAELHRSSGAIGEAIRLLQADVAVAEEPEQVVRLREELAEIWQAQGEYLKAEKQLLRTLRDYPKESDYIARARLRLAGIADQAGRVGPAIARYREVAEADVDAQMKASALFGEAALLRRIGQGTKALPLMDLAMEKLPTEHPTRGAIAVERAELLVELGQSSAEALESMLEEARRSGLEEAQPVAYNELLVLLAGELQKAERHEDALSILERVAQSPAAAEDPSLRHVALERQVASLMGMGRRAEADDLLDRAPVAEMSSGVAEDNCSARMSRAKSRAETGEVRQAATEFKDLFARCLEPRFLLHQLPEVADALVTGGARQEAVQVLTAVRDGKAGVVGRQAAQLELGRLGSVQDLDAAMEGPDRGLAALARVERAEHYAAEGMLAHAEPLWKAVLDEPATEPVPRGLALIGMGRLAAARNDPDKAAEYLEAARDVAPEPWLKERAEGLLRRLAALRSGSAVPVVAPAGSGVSGRSPDQGGPRAGSGAAGAL